jgi:hypothetical protein
LNLPTINNDANLGSNDLTLAIFPDQFPGYILEEEYVEESREIIAKIACEVPKTEQTPKFISSLYTAGFWRVECFDLYSRDWLIQILSSLNSIMEGNLQVKPIKELPKYKFSVQMSGEVMDDYKILKHFERFNTDIQLDASLWKNLEFYPNEGGYLLYLELDPVSFEKIRKNKYQLSFGVEKVTFKGARY